MEALVLDGKNYVKASKAAKDLGYASDYVGQLCRKGQIEAKLIGRTWYVDAEQLGSHRVEKKRMSRVKAREQAKKAIIEVRSERGAETKDVSRNLDIRYESDERDLIPQTRKLGVESVGLEPGRYAQPEPAYDSENVIENKGEKVLMSGSIDVVDVTDVPLDTETVILTPRKIRSSPRIEIPKRRELPVAVEEENTPEEAQPKSFIDKLEEATVIPVVEAGVEPENAVTSETGTSSREGARPSLWVPFFVVLLVFILVLGTIPLYQTISYYGGENSYSAVTYKFSLDKIVAIIKLII